VDDLNDKIAFRPGVIELVERNILPANEDLQEAIKGMPLYLITRDIPEMSAEYPISSILHLLLDILVVNCISRDSVFCFSAV